MIRWIANVVESGPEVFEETLQSARKYLLAEAQVLDRAVQLDLARLRSWSMRLVFGVIVAVVALNALSVSVVLLLLDFAPSIPRGLSALCISAFFGLMAFYLTWSASREGAHLGTSLKTVRRIFGGN